MKPFRERNPIVVGLVSVAVLAAATLFAFSLERFPFFRGVYLIEADFADASGLTTANEVRIAGLRAGQVRSIELAGPDPGDVLDRVRVTLEVPSGIRLGAETQAEIKLRTILGQKYVEIAPSGGPPYIGDGNVIPLERTRIPFEIYEITNRAVETLGDVDAQALNDSLRTLADLVEDPEGNLGRALAGLSEATEGLREREGDLEDLVRAGGEILEVLGSRSQALGRIFDSGSELLEALSARSDGLRRFVRSSDRLAAELSDFLVSTRADLDPALRDLHETLVVARDQIRPLEDALEALGPSAHSFARAFTQGRWGDVWLQSILGLPIPPILPGGGISLPLGTTGQEGAASQPSEALLDSILLGAAR